MVMLSTWFTSNLLKVHDKKTQVMILGNPFKNLFFALATLLFFFFERNNLSFEILMILDTIRKLLKL